MYRNNIQPSAPPLQPSAPPLQPSAPPLPQNQSEVQNYIDQYIQRTDPYNAGPPRQEGETMNEWSIKQQQIGSGQYYYSYPAYRTEFQQYNERQTQYISEVRPREKSKKKSLISRFFSSLTTCLCCPICCCVYGCMEYL